MKKISRVDITRDNQLCNPNLLENRGDIPVKEEATQEKQLLPETLKFGKYTISPSDGISIKKGKDELRIGDYMRILAINRDISTNEESYELEYYRSSLRKIDRVIVPGESLTGMRIENLMKYGIDVHAGNKKIVSEVLIKTKEYAKVLTTYNHYGWSKVEEEPIFFHENAISRDGKLEEYKLANSAKLNLIPKGTLDMWMAAYEAFVKGKTPLEFAVVLGCSAPVVAYLSQTHDDLKTMFVNITGQSSQGKTTMTMLALSVAGNPTSRNNGLLKTWSSTQNAITGHLNHVNGIPIAFDELSMSNSKNLTALLYSMTEGRQKSRLKKDGSQREIAEWSTTIISNGEVSLFNRLDNNLGLRVRIMEFAHIAWTESAEQSEAIKQAVHKNYGHLLPLFVSKLLADGLESIDEEFDIQRKDILTKIPETETSKRVSIKLAAITTTASLLKKLGVLDIDVSSLQNFLIENDKVNFDSRDMSAKALDDVCKYLVVNQSKLLRDNTGQTPFEVIGKLSVKYTGSTKQIEVAIITSQFEAMMEDLNYQDAKVVIKEWQKKHILKTENDRLTLRKNFSIEGKQERLTTYAFLIPEEYHDLLQNLPGQDINMSVASAFSTKSFSHASEKLSLEGLKTIDDSDFE